MKKILIIEDEQQIAHLESEILRYAGFDVTIAYEGMDGYVKFMNDNYDCVITDLMMPMMDGRKLIDLIRASNKDVPIIVVSADTEIYTQNRVEELGANMFLAKPFTLDQITTAVENVMKNN